MKDNKRLMNQGLKQLKKEVLDNMSLQERALRITEKINSIIERTGMLFIGHDGWEGYRLMVSQSVEALSKRQPCSCNGMTCPDCGVSNESTLKILPKRKRPEIVYCWSCGKALYIKGKRRKVK